MNLDNARERRLRPPSAAQGGNLRLRLHCGLSIRLTPASLDEWRPVVERNLKRLRSGALDLDALCDELAGAVGDILPAFTRMLRESHYSSHAAIEAAISAAREGTAEMRVAQVPANPPHEQPPDAQTGRCGASFWRRAPRR